MAEKDFDRAVARLRKRGRFTKEPESGAKDMYCAPQKLAESFVLHLGRRQPRPAGSSDACGCRRSNQFTGISVDCTVVADGFFVAARGGFRRSGRDLLKAMPPTHGPPGSKRGRVAAAGLATSCARPQKASGGRGQAQGAIVLYGRFALAMSELRIAAPTLFSKLCLIGREQGRRWPARSPQFSDHAWQFEPWPLEELNRSAPHQTVRSGVKN